MGYAGSKCSRLSSFSGGGRLREKDQKETREDKSDAATLERGT